MIIDKVISVIKPKKGVKMRSKINFHVHTTYSDGKKTVSEVVSELKGAGIEYFAITDHNTVDGNLEATEYAKKYKIKHFNGIELSCKFSNGEIGFDDLHGCHILGLGIKIDEMKKRQEAHKENEKSNVLKLHELLVANGYNLGCINGNSTIKNIRNELIEKGYAKDKDDCKRKILSEPAYRKYAYLDMDVQTEIKIIKECGGFAIWAHPFETQGFIQKTDLNKDQISELLDLLCKYGLDGIEVYYHNINRYTAEKIKFLENLADNKKLIKSIGTDYHYPGNISFDVDGIIPDESIINYL